MDMKGLRKDLRKIPNQVTFSRLLFIPLLIFLACTHQLVLLTVLYIIQWQFDSLDGYLARKLGQTSRMGAFYDAVVDEIDVLFSILYLYLVYPGFIMENLLLISLMWAFTLLNRIISSIRHGPYFRLHLYSGKYSVSIFHVFVAHSMFFSPSRIYFLATAAFLMIFLIEELFLLLRYRKLHPDAGSIFLLR